MSRAPPFPTNSARRSRSPASDVRDSIRDSFSQPTRPLQINRTSSRQPPDVKTFPSGPLSAAPPNGPYRPQRSDLRARQAPENFSNYAFTDGARTSLVAGDRRRPIKNGGEDRRPPTKKLNGLTRAGDIDAVLDQIKDDWEFVIDPDFNSVDLALQLLDASSLGKDINSFRRTKNMLSIALKGSVDKYFEAFAASLPHHGSLLNHLDITSKQIRDARSSLMEAKDALGTKRADLVQLWTRSQMLEEMIKLLDQIENLKVIPDLLETLISEKRFLQASVLLVRSLKTINSADMLEVGAVSDLRSYLAGQETSLREILTDELQSHLYLKSYWCEIRWASYVPNQQTFQKVEFEDDPNSSLSTKIQSLDNDPENSKPSRLVRFLNDLSLRPNDPPHDLEDPQMRRASGLPSASSSSLNNLTTQSSSLSQPRNPEADSFAYMESLLESLAVLGKLGAALDTVAQRIPAEIYSLVETTLDEVAERAEYTRQGSLLGSPGVSTTVVDGAISVVTTGSFANANMRGAQVPMLKASHLRLAAFETSSKQADHETLKDFFWTLYSKFDAVTQGLRVVYEVSNRIGSRLDFKDSSGAKPGALFPLADVWMPIQAEVRTLLYDYLTDEEQGTVSGRNPISSINEILRDGKVTRDRSKLVFRFADADIKLASKTLKKHEDELTRVLRDTMPGLVHTSSDQAVQMTIATVGMDDRMIGAGQRHRTLIRPHAFHVTVMFQPTLTFLSRVMDILPSGADAATASGNVLDEFVLKVYLPQLEEKVLALFQHAITASDAFQPDPLSARLSSRPLIKASTQLMALINSLCATLRMTPFHQENYSRMILGVIIQFYQRCSDRFQDLVSLKQTDRSDDESGSEPRLALAALWSQKTELSPILSNLLNVDEHNPQRQLQFCQQETRLQLTFLGDDTIKKEDLIPAIRNLSALASLYHSITWFAEGLNSLKVAQEEFSPTTPKYLELASATTPHTPNYLPNLLATSPDEPLQLPLSREMAMRFQALLKTYEQLAALILDTIRTDIRCRTIHYLHAAMRLGNYTIDREAAEPDPHIIDLNTELGQCDDFVSAALPKRKQQYVFVGLGQLMEQQLISNTRHIRLANAFGVKKILRNITALQQGIRTITNEPQPRDFDRARRYYSLFFISPQEMLDGIRKKQQFMFDEYKTMLSLKCGVDEAEGDTGVAKATDRNYTMYLIDLHGFELESPSLEVRDS